MLCPGCVSHGLPQAQRILSTFGDDVVVLGLHTAGRIRLNAFGHLDDLALGASLARLIDERPPTDGCEPDEGCLVPTKETHP